MQWISLAVWIAVCLGVGALGGRWTLPEIPEWYRGLAKPAFNPPNRLFGPVWTALYVLMAVAVWRVWEAADSLRRSWGLGLFALQLGLNLAWSWIFFKRHALGAALVEVVALWAAIGATAVVFAGVDAVAAWLLLPYWAWVSFAFALNEAIWRLNRNRSRDSAG